MRHEWGTGGSASPQTMLFTANVKKTSLRTRRLQPLVLGEAAEMLERGKGLFLGKGATTERPSRLLEAGGGGDLAPQAALCWSWDESYNLT